MNVLGLMSGTSADGVDAVMAEFEGPVERPRWRILSNASTPYRSDLRERLVAVGQGERLSASEVLDLAEAVTLAQAYAARACDPEGKAQLVGCHGQTLWHRPPEEGRRGLSWQLLLAPLLAGLLRRPVVFDFRSGDLVLGGQGAPLVPIADAALLGGIGGWRAVLNLGGIANLTLLPPVTGPERHAYVQGWDCGPANTLLDLAVTRFSKGQRSFDDGGSWSRQGCIEEQLISAWLHEPYFQQPPPKSTGRELFGSADLDRRLTELRRTAPRHGPADALATLTAFTAAVVAQDLERGPCPLELLVAGGGARNTFLMEQLTQRCRGTGVFPLNELGIGDQQREALAFALFAWWNHRGYRGSLPSVTGAKRPTVMGLTVSPPG